ncbi:MAG: glucose-1-phosphate thymidylyltransferase RfbA [Ruminiclostridium sp.]|nr:glucose-1-phosphate thymidylyltransferase RfbA [Ruminiclostridium sp.]
MKGIILAGGSGTRLYPLTRVTSKQLLPVYDKPMIFYPLSTLMLAGIRQILIISTPEDLPNFRKLLGNGSEFGLELSYKVQESPDGLAQAFVIGEDFIGSDCVAMVLGDNIFYGNSFGSMLTRAVYRAEKEGVASVFGKYVNDPERFGIAEIDENGKVISLEEKPKLPKSNYAVVGLYFYPNDVVKYAKEIRPSERGEFEITDLNRIYMEKERLTLSIFGRGFSWLDTGTMSSLYQATNYVRAIEEVQGISISVPEEIAFYNGWITREDVLRQADLYGKSSYGDYLRKVASGDLDNEINKKSREVVK